MAGKPPMKNLIPCNSSLTKVTLVFYFPTGEVVEKPLHVPKRQKNEFFVRVWEKNPQLVRMVVKAKSGTILYDQSR